MIKKFLKATSSYWEVISLAVAIAACDAVVQRYPECNFSHIHFCNWMWTRSLFKRLNFVRRADTIRKNEITEGSRKEAELTFVHQIAQHIEILLVSLSMIVNFAQTNSMFVSFIEQEYNDWKRKELSSNFQIKWQTVYNSNIDNRIWWYIFPSTTNQSRQN